LDTIRGLLAPADTLGKSKGPIDEYHTKEPVVFDQLGSGSQIIHPTFGRGVVVELHPGGVNAAVSIKFEDFDEPKKVVFRFAKLVQG
jgi:hypothetical protein